MIFGAITANVFADNSFKNMADDPFKNIGEIDDHTFHPPGYADKLRIYPIHWIVNSFFSGDDVIMLD